MNVRFDKAWGQESPRCVDLTQGRRKRLLYCDEATAKDSDVDRLGFASSDTSIPYDEIQSHRRVILRVCFAKIGRFQFRIHGQLLGCTRLHKPPSFEHITSIGQSEREDGHLIGE